MAGCTPVLLARTRPASAAPLSFATIAMQFKLVYIMAATLLTAVCGAPVKIGPLDIESRASELDSDIAVPQERGCRMYSCI
ncbi:hypothetical protein B0H15DRAFT_868363, partial [Mycena belliarum]